MFALFGKQMSPLVDIKSETPAIYPMHNGLLMLHLENKSPPVTNPLAENANVGDSKNTVVKIMRIVFTAKPPVPQSYSQRLSFPKDAW
jgi:hypothetical protein